MSILSRINRLHIIAAGGVVFVALVVAFALAFLQPGLREIEAVETKQGEYETTWRTLPDKVAVLGQAQRGLARNKAQADAFLATMPKISTNPFDAMFDMRRVYGPQGIGPKVYGFLVSTGPRISGVTFPTAGLQPVVVPPIIALGMGGFSIEARSFPAVLSFLRQLKDMPLPGVISGVRISGTSPNLRVPMPLTVYIVTPQAVTGQVAAGSARVTGATARAGGRDVRNGMRGLDGRFRDDEDEED